MIDRVLNKDLPQKIGQNISIAGWVDIRRDHGKLIFLDIRDRSGIAQVVVTPKASGALETAKTLRPQWVVAIQGEAKERPESMQTEGKLGRIELVAEQIQVLSESQELPFDLSGELNLDTYLDYLPLTMRSQRARDIFAVQASILEAYRASLHAQDFTEYVSPAIVGGDAEGGAAVFKVDYHYDKTAYLATSPQLYKQIMVGPLERVCTIAKVFRAEKSSTTRHLSEITQMDFEMGFIQSHLDVLKVLEQVIRDVVNTVGEKHADIFSRFKVEIPKLPEKQFPILTLKEVHKILGIKEASDMDPEQERRISEWAKKEHGSDFIFITAFPSTGRAFYTYEDPAEAPYSRGFDLLFRGLEINSGSQRIHNYESIISRMKERGLDPEKFSYYLQAFKYGMPPHGGSSTGLERFTARMLELANVKEATAFPRDMNRIDVRLRE